MGGVNISNKIHFTLIFALIILFGISASSANEINNTDVGSISTSHMDETNNVLTESSDTSNTNLKEDVSQKTSVLSENTESDVSKKNIGSSNKDTELNSIQTDTHVDAYGNELTSSTTNNQIDNTNNELTTTQTNNNGTKEKTKLTISSTSIVHGKYLYVYLKNSAGKGIPGQKITITFNNNKYTKTTNANGRISLKMDSKATKYYTVNVKYSESTSYLATSKSFKVKVYKLKTEITINSKSILRGKYLHVFLKDSNGNALSSKKVTIKINKKSYKKYTNKNGEATLKIISKTGNYPVKIMYAGSTTYLSTSKSFTLKSYIDKTKITVSNSKVIKGNYLYAYLKNSANKAIPNQKITITFNNKKYTRTTNSNGKISLKLNVKSDNYKTIIKYSGSTSYKSSSKTLTIKVIANTNAKIIATNKITKGSYSVRLVDNLGAPIANKQIIIYTYNGTQSAGSGISITKKKIILNSDNIYNKATDTKLLNDIATILRSKGYEVIVNTNINPNAHCSDIMGDYSNACVFCIFGGVDSGMFRDMSSKWYQNYLKTYNNEVVLGFTRTSRNLATETWLERAHDDNYSPNSFTGLANPGTYLNNNGFDYVYGNTAAQLAENFLNYAIKGLSIGKDNILPGVSSTYAANTDENGYATISGISEGYYKVISSCSDTSGYIVDSVTSYLTVK